MITLYGIKNCDTVKKSMQWFKNRNIAVEFHDYKTKGISEEKLKAWSEETNWDSLINKKGTTWRNLSDSIKEKVKDQEQAIILMKEQTSVIKRPVIELDGKIKLIGFDEEKYEKLFGSHLILPH